MRIACPDGRVLKTLSQAGQERVAWGPASRAFEGDSHLLRAAPEGFFRTKGDCPPDRLPSLMGGRPEVDRKIDAPDGTAYPDSIASILRDAFGRKRAAESMLAYARVGLFQSDA